MRRVESLHRTTHKEAIFTEKPVNPKLLDMKVGWLTLVAMALVGTLRADEILFQDNFKGRLGPGWSWMREHPQAWRVTEHGLEVRIEPGNMWGPENSARNLLVRSAPDTSTSEIEISVNVENKPSNQYEQVDLVWYYNDSNMVKIGQELVDGKLSVVMGREENDKTRTIAIVPLDSSSVRLRMIVKGSHIRGEFKTAGASDWHAVGQCDAPAIVNGQAKLSLQFYQGPLEVEHWARVTEFIIRTGVKS
jgi:regulation of enolase protein 1 (concanavalin A-like superfamily)